MLAVDTFTGEEYLELKSKSKTEDVSEYLASLCFDCSQKGYLKLSIILDNNSTHKAKMQLQLQTHLSNLNIQNKISVEFIYTPPYSPNFNLVEYLIHLLRLRFLHHLPLGINLQQIQEKLKNYFKFNQLQTPKQIQNIIQHICNLVKPNNGEIVV